MIAHYIVGTEQTMVELRTTALLGCFRLNAYAAYLGKAVYVFGYRYNLVSTLSLATVVWVMCFYAVVRLDALSTQCNLIKW